MCEHLQGVADVTAAARALTLACLIHAGGPPPSPYNLAYDHVACEPMPDDLTALIEQLRASTPERDQAVPMWPALHDV